MSTSGDAALLAELEAAAASRELSRVETCLLQRLRAEEALARGAAGASADGQLLRQLLAVADTPSASLKLVHKVCVDAGLIRARDGNTASVGLDSSTGAGVGVDSPGAGVGVDSPGAAASASKDSLDVGMDGADEHADGKVEEGEQDRAMRIVDARVELRGIRNWLRPLVPVTAVAESEEIVFSGTGDFAEYSGGNTVSVDAFLYDDDDVDDLVDAGAMSRHFCGACGSRDVKPLNFISHSLSIDELEFIFSTSPLTSVVSPARATLVDVGSRLGAVLLGAAFFARFRRCVGVELNAELCDAQRRAMDTFRVQERTGSEVEVVCSDVMEQPAVVAAADVLVLHNAFQFFASSERSAIIWRFIAQHTKPGCVIVASPSLTTQLQCCGKQRTPDLDAWVKPIPVDYPVNDNADDASSVGSDTGLLFDDICMYTVLESQPA